MLAIDQHPMQVAIGWSHNITNRRDAVETARGYVARRFTAKEASWFTVEPFMDGYFWEAHEGGPGKSYLKAIVRELADNPGGKYWLPSSRDRVMQIAMREGKPSPVILNETDGLAVKNSGQMPLLPKERMKPYARQGQGTLVFGGTLAALGLIFFLGSIGFNIATMNPSPSVRAVELEELPHSQWALVSGTSTEQIVSKLEMKDGDWKRPEMRAHIIDELETERQRGRELNAAFNLDSVPGTTPEPAAGAADNQGQVQPTRTGPAAGGNEPKGPTPPPIELRERQGTSSEGEGEASGSSVDEGRNLSRIREMIRQRADSMQPDEAPETGEAE